MNRFSSRCTTTRHGFLFFTHYDGEESPFFPSLKGFWASPIFHGQNYVRDVLETKLAELSYVNTDDNVSDIGTKALAKAKFEAFRRALGIVSLSELVAEMKPADAAMMRAKLGV